MGRAEDLFRRLSDQGEANIDQMIQDRQSEELFRDFKRSADGGGGPRLHQTDRENLAKAISGFGNSEGGVILWGVDCRDLPAVGDVAQARVPIQNPQRFLSWLEGAVSGCTLPPHPGVRQVAIEQPGSHTGFVATLVPRSYLAPHQCVLGRPYYYIRAGSDFLPAPHGVLAGLFGRRPEPFVFHGWNLGPVRFTGRSVHFHIGFTLNSRGPGIARDLYVTVQSGLPNAKSELSYECPDSKGWTGSMAYGQIIHLTSVDGFKLAPGAIVQPIILHFRLESRFEHELWYAIQFGHAHSPVREISGRTSPQAITTAWEKLRAAPGATDVSRTFVRTVLALPDPAEQAAEEFYKGSRID
jgi:hypothetical protein